jgi:hypothetical protein
MQTQPSDANFSTPDEHVDYQDSSSSCSSESEERPLSLLKEHIRD